MANQILIRTHSSLLLTLLFFASCSAITPMEERFELVSYTTSDGGKIEGAFFNAEGDLVVIFAHGAIFNKESWYFLAEKLQAEDISSLSTTAKEEAQVRNQMTF